jgi:hypothetical protein
MKKYKLAILAFLALSAAADARGLHGGGPSGAPPPPSPGLPAPLTVYNTSGSTATSVPVSYEQPFATGDIPSGYHAVIYSGATPLTTQQDTCSSWLQDGSCKSTQLSFVASSIAGSGNNAYTVQAVAGAPTNTTNISTAQATANTNICVKTSDLTEANGTAETGTWRLACLNDIIANYSQFNSSTGYGTNPTGGWEYYSQGSVKIGIHAWQFAKRESDSAIHKWIRTDLWVDMRGSGSTPCPCSVAFLVNQPNQFGPVAAGTVGNATETAYNFTATLTNSGSVLRQFGGSSDSRTMTVANAKFNTTTKFIDLTTTWLGHTQGVFPVVLTCAVTCPTGLANGHTYFIHTVDGQSDGMDALYEHQCDVVNNFTGCSSGLVSFSDQGSGTITLTPLVFTNPYGGFLGLDTDANRAPSPL